MLTCLCSVTVIPVLFQNSLHQPKDPAVTLDHIFGVEPTKITSPSTDSEIALALRVLEGCCLLYSRCTALAHKYKAVQDFEEYSGLEKVAELLKDIQVEEHIRQNYEQVRFLHVQVWLGYRNAHCVAIFEMLKCGEFLLLLIGHVYVKENTPIHEQMRNLLGEQCASLIWAASRFGSTLDAEQRQMALQIQARRVVESLEPY
ncbi:hypothetical protein TRIUR3_26226 [Triticum urartu]|uniref:Uncharacterized protein n=2 Tax=Triticum TaxID=4564 RepID=A0A9R1BI24_TRITD|nr:hypothetical protein TRIUR3_26226 [Triticum urartu]VAI69341.1 unnamed protein product [Triticum turgidum subsp. durum]